MESKSNNPSKPYVHPHMKTLTVEEARKFLAEHADYGDQGAIDLLEVIEQNNKERIRFLESA